MKGLLTAIVLAALAASAYFVFFSGGANTDPADGGQGLTNAAGTGEDQGASPIRAKKGDGAVEAEVLAKNDNKPKPKVPFEELRRSDWEKLRPASERFVPDPDNVGPCPPVSNGGRPTRVVRRYLDPDNGARVWFHDDGTYTTLSFGVGSYTDRSTGETRPNEVVSTLVQEKTTGIAPDELPLVNAPKKGDKGAGQSGDASKNK